MAVLNKFSNSILVNKYKIAKETLDLLVNELNKRGIPVDSVSNIVEVNPSDVFALLPVKRLRSRDRDYMQSQHLLRYILYRRCNMTLKEIGVQTGGFDHTTIINSIKRAGQLLETDDSFISMYESAIDKLGNQKK